MLHRSPSAFACVERAGGRGLCRCGRPLPVHCAPGCLCAARSPRQRCLLTFEASPSVAGESPTSYGAMPISRVNNVPRCQPSKSHHMYSGTPARWLCSMQPKTSERSRYGWGTATWAPREIYVGAAPGEKLGAIEAVAPPHLRKGKFRPPDKLIAFLKAKY